MGDFLDLSAPSCKPFRQKSHNTNVSDGVRAPVLVSTGGALAG